MSYNFSNHTCYEPTQQNSKYYSYTADIAHQKIDDFKYEDTVWFTLKTLCTQAANNIPTWAAYNSLLLEEQHVNTFTSLPIINGSPTNWENLYNSIKEAEKLSNKVYPHGKTIISFDLQLYAKAIRLQAKPDVSNNFVFRIGELHVVFTVLKMLGKLIDGSGLDQAFQEAGTLIF